MATFASSTSIKRMLGIPSSVTQHDDAIADLLDVIDQIVLDELGLDASGSTSYTEKIDFTDYGQSKVSLKYRPVLTVSSFKISGQSQTEGSNYKIDKSLGVITLMPITNFFPVGTEVMEITYTAGFASAPADLVYAGNLIACSLFNQQSHVGFASEKAGSYSYSLGKGTGSTIPQIAQRILGKYRRVFTLGAV